MSDVATLLPPNATQTERALEQATARIGDVAVPIATLWSADTCPEHVLPFLAWGLSVDNWDSNWAEEDKRTSIRDSVQIHRVKGTIGSIKRALFAAGYDEAEVIERYGWETYNGAQNYDGSITYAEPDHWAEYRIKLTSPITIAQAQQVRSILATVAPARCHLKALEYPEALHIYDNSILFDGAFAYGVA
jgi:phage tail P2-like protein